MMANSTHVENNQKCESKPDVMMACCGCVEPLCCLLSVLYQLSAFVCVQVSNCYVSVQVLASCVFQECPFEGASPSLLFIGKKSHIFGIVYVCNVFSPDLNAQDQSTCLGFRISQRSLSWSVFGELPTQQVHVLCVRDVMWYTGCVWWKVQGAPRDGSQAGNVELVGHKGAGKCGEEHLYAKRNVL